MSKNLALTDAHYTYLRRQHSHAGDALLAELRRETEALGDISRMLIPEEQGTLLGLLVAATGAREVIEIGTFTGYSSTCLARALPEGGRLLCCDQSDEWTAIARRYWAQTGVAERIELRLGRAAATLEALEPGRTFDFAFIDADKTGYDGYYEKLLPWMRRNGLMVFDNMLAHGRVLKPANEDDRALDALNHKLARDPRVECVLLPVADGLQLCRKR
jgi:caffeoyl-CoA O-methyltransferase